MATYKELKAQAEALHKQMEMARRSEITVVVAEIREKMKEYGITLAMLKGGVNKSAPRVSSVVAKYLNPVSGESWSGRGRSPKWLADELAKGRSKEEFLVGGQAGAA